MTYLMNRAGITLQFEVPFQGYSSIYTIPVGIMYKAPQELVDCVKSKMAVNSPIEFFDDNVAEAVIEESRKDGVGHIESLERFMAKRGKKNKKGE